MVDSATGTILAEVCHIRAASPNGPRFLEGQDPEERHGFGNLVLMCRNHHKIIDDRANLDDYTPDRLLAIKASHEAASALSPLPNLSESDVRRLLDTIAPTYSVQWDMRGATFNAGGLGGNFGGAGGGGGVITFVGITPRALEGHVDLRGGEGAFPGGGGGGGGVAAFIGRPATDGDRELGFKVQSLLLANSAESRSGLIGVLGGAWERYELENLPGWVTGAIVCVLDLGSLPLGSLLAIRLLVRNPSGSDVFSDDAEVAVDDVRRPVMGTRVCRRLHFQAVESGVHRLLVLSGELELASVRFEVRQKTPSS